MTKLMYIQHPDLFELSAQVIQHGRDNRGTYLVLNQSLFYFRLYIQQLSITMKVKQLTSSKNRLF